MAIRQRMVFDLSPEEVERFDQLIQQAGIKHRIEFLRFLLREYEERKKKSSEKK